MPRLESKDSCREHDAGQHAVVFERVTVRRSGVLILDDVSAVVRQGGCTAIVGPNGAGKSTLLMALLGGIRYAGSIRVAPRPDGAPARIGYVPQRLDFDRGMPLTVLDFLVMGLQRRPLWLGTKRVHRARARELLAEVNAESLERRMLGVLSGGELQRVLVALALAQEPDLLVLDEPASGVDVHGGQMLCELLERLRRERGFTQLMVSHDLATVTHHATHAIMLNKKVVAEGTPRDVFSLENLGKVFGLHMGLVNTSMLANHAAADGAACCGGNGDV